jgi:hypothetical protein
MTTHFDVIVGHARSCYLKIRPIPLLVSQRYQCRGLHGVFGLWTTSVHLWVGSHASTTALHPHFFFMKSCTL